MSEIKRIWILTMFPEFFEQTLQVGVVGQTLNGLRGKKFEVHKVLIRQFSPKDYKGVDDSPYGGGPGMVMRADVLKEALMKGVVEAGNYHRENWKKELSVIYTGPRGKTWNNEIAREFASRYLNADDKDVAFICGRYEGVDERFLEEYVDETYSVGDYVLTGGEPAVLVMLDSALRFVGGTLGNQSSADKDSFESHLLEYPQYTRPREFEGKLPPEEVMSGHHAEIEKFRLKQQIEMTKKLRPDLYQKYLLERDKK